MEEKVFTQEEAAGIIGISTATLNRYVAQGHVKCVKLGRQRLFSSASVSAAMKLNRRNREKKAENLPRAKRGDRLDVIEEKLNRVLKYLEPREENVQ